LNPKTVPLLSHSLTALQLAKQAFSKGTYSEFPKVLENPSATLLFELPLATANASLFKTVGALVFMAKADIPQNTESVWNNLHLSITAYEGFPDLRKSIAYYPNN
jgi:hypothetical protein